MTHYDLLLAAQLMAEERFGRSSRQLEREQNAKETEARRRLLRSVGS